MATSGRTTAGQPYRFKVGHVAVLQRESTLVEENSQCIVLVDGVAGGRRDR